MKMVIARCQAVDFSSSQKVGLDFELNIWLNVSVCFF